MNIYTDLARKAIKNYLNNQKLPETKSIPEEISNQKAGCFVSLHTQNNDLRGCIGTIKPIFKNLGDEIMNNAISATMDPRFPPLKLDELDNIVINVDVLSKPEIINSPKLLDIKKYGVIVSTLDGRLGVLLPDIEGIKNISDQINIACQKAGIDPNEKYTLHRFTVQRFKES